LAQVKDVGVRKPKASTFLAGLALLLVARNARAAQLDVSQAINLITDTADKICNVVSTKGAADSSEVKGDVSAQLNALARGLAALGFSGSGSIKSDQYQNVLRTDLASTLRDNANCKLKVFSELQAKILPKSRSDPPEHNPTLGPHVEQNSSGDHSPNINNSNNVRIE
jgi:hypothetical protein